MEVKRSFMGSTFFWFACMSSLTAFGASAVNSDNVFGIDANGRVYHKDGGQRGNFAYLCLNGNCQPAQLKNGQWQAQFSPSSGSHHIEFKVDSAQGQCISKANNIDVGDGVNSSVCIYNESLALRRKGEFGIDNNGIVYHLNDDLTARFVYLCVDGDCQPAYKSGNYWERSIGQRSGVYDLKLKIQDDIIGQCIHSANNVAVGESRSDTPCADPLPNRLPSVEAGNDVSVEENKDVVLTGFASDDDGDIISYTWSQVGGPVADLPSTNTDVVAFIAPEVSETSELTFELSVSDDEGGVSTDRVVVTVIHVNKAPIISAGEDIAVEELTSVTLLGEATDADGDTLSYEWQQISGPTASIVNNTSKSLTFTAPEVAENTLLEFEFIVSDGQGAVVSDRVTVSVAHVNKLPTVSAGEDQTVQELLPVTLTATASDLDGDALSFTWRQLSGPTPTIANKNTATLEFTAPEVPNNTTMAFEVTVFDGQGGVASDQVSVKVIHVNKLPVVSAGADQTVDELSTVTLVGQASDTDGDALSFEWLQISGPPVTLANPMASSIQFNAPEVATNNTLVFELRVSDEQGGVVSDRVVVNILHVNKPPALSISTAVGVDEGTAVTITSEVSDPDGDALTFTWRQLSGPTADFDPSVQTLEFIAPEVPEDSVLSFELIVSDGNGGIATGQVSFSVNHVNKAPTVSVENDLIVEEQSSVDLVGTAFDADSDELFIEWQQVSGTVVDISNANTLTANFVAPEVLDDEFLVFRLTATDPYDLSDTAEITVVVTNTNKAPTVTIEDDFSIPAASYITIRSDISDDGHITDFKWEQTEGNPLPIVRADESALTLIIDENVSPQNVTFTLLATDNEGDSASDSISIDIKPQLNLQTIGEPSDFPVWNEASMNIIVGEGSSLSPASATEDGYNTYIVNEFVGFSVSLEENGAVEISGESIPTFVVGDIIVGIAIDNTTGFTRRITAIDGNRLQTEQASLASAYPNANLELKILITNGEPNSAQLYSGTAEGIVTNGIKHTSKLSINKPITIDLHLAIEHGLVTHLNTSAFINILAENQLLIDTDLSLSREFLNRFPKLFELDKWIDINEIPFKVGLSAIPTLGVSIASPEALSAEFGFVERIDGQTGFSFTPNGQQVNSNLVLKKTKVGPEFTLEGGGRLSTKLNLNLVSSLYEAEIDIPAQTNVNIDGAGLSIGLGASSTFSVVSESNGDDLICDLTYKIQGKSFSNIGVNGFGSELNIDANLPIFSSDNVTLWQSSECPFEVALGSVTGQVTDQNGNVLSGVNVKITNSNGELVQSLSTDSQGLYNFSDINTGIYNVIFEKESFLTAEASVEVIANQTVVLPQVLFLEQGDDQEVGNIQLSINDAQNPSQLLDNVTIIVREGLNSPSGNYIDTLEFNDEAQLFELDTGYYTLEITREEYTPAFVSITIIGGETVNRTISLSRIDDGSNNDGELGLGRIVLTWGENPRDLDSHLTFDEHHVYYSRQNVPGANLDVDDTSSFGPETITIDSVKRDTTYNYYVHNFSQTGDFYQSNAEVNLYLNGTVRTFRPPVGSGIYWDVFSIENGQIIACSENCLSPNSPSNNSSSILEVLPSKE